MLTRGQGRLKRWAPDPAEPWPHEDPAATGAWLSRSILVGRSFQCALGDDSDEDQSDNRCENSGDQQPEVTRPTEVQRGHPRTKQGHRNDARGQADGGPDQERRPRQAQVRRRPRWLRRTERPGRSEARPRARSCDPASRWPERHTTSTNACFPSVVPAIPNPRVRNRRRTRSASRRRGAWLGRSLAFPARTLPTVKSCTSV